MYKAIIFDIGGVVHSAENIFPYTAIADGFGVDPEKSFPTIKSHLLELEKGVVTEGQFWKILSQAFGKDIPKNPHELLIKNISNYAKSFPEMIDFIKELKTKGYVTAALSNVSAAHAEVVKNLDIYPIFDYRFLSFELNMTKPNADIFGYALKQLQMNPEECIFVDDVKENLKNPEKLGIKTILAKNPHQVILEIEDLIKD